MVEQTQCTSEKITHSASARNRQKTVNHTCKTRDSLVITPCPCYLLQARSDSYM